MSTTPRDSYSDAVFSPDACYDDVIKKVRLGRAFCGESPFSVLLAAGPIVVNEAC